MRTISLQKTLVALLLAACSCGAAAQYVWIDPSGTRQYSDQPPPASIPKSKILKQPGTELRTPAAAAAAEADAASAKVPTKDPALDGSADAAKQKGPVTTADRNAEFVKRRAEQAEKDKKAAEAASLAAEKARNCERARNYYRSLSSGERIASTDRNGEKVYLSDEKREQDLRETSQVLAGCK